ncbi:MAG: 2-amino-4-hydroxy-6-hydroxymethyldihydropteridine diphosphokinase [Candidatus Omnitrophica bacterium]|nr:2-amino-4-hydroxy-6-hydroxymethyldihydropteridine diphosphokinase [Candidatus Omnitrophota bacterium]
MAIGFIGVGTNLGNRLLNLKRTGELITASSKIKILDQSAIYETVPIGGPPQGHFLNAVWKIESSLSAPELLKELQSIEVKLGRVRTIKNAPRTIDLDILDYDGMILESPELTLPHPRMNEREFVLRPLRNIGNKKV